MSGFEDYRQDTAALEREIEVRGVVLGIDWHDEAQVTDLAREALTSSPAHVEALVRDSDPALRAKGELFAFGVLMLRTMAESAGIGVHSHGGTAWKAFGRALLKLSASARGDVPASPNT